MAGEGRSKGLGFLEKKYSSSEEDSSIDSIIAYYHMDIQDKNSSVNDCEVASF